MPSKRRKSKAKRDPVVAIVDACEEAARPLRDSYDMGPYQTESCPCGRLRAAEMDLAHVEGLLEDAANERNVSDQHRRRAEVAEEGERMSREEIDRLREALTRLVSAIRRRAEARVEVSRLQAITRDDGQDDDEMNAAIDHESDAITEVNAALAHAEEVARG